MASSYAKERYNPNLSHCSKLSLKFDGESLVLEGGRKRYEYPAVSGRAQPNGSFEYSPSRQRIPSTGPIPEGVYWIRPDELWEYSWYHKYIFRMDDRGWGAFRISVHPFPTTETFGRGGMFIHGGLNPGSAGCIDLTKHIERFVLDLRSELPVRRCQIHLAVRYNVAR